MESPGFRQGEEILLLFVILKQVSEFMLLSFLLAPYLDRMVLAGVAKIYTY